VVALLTYSASPLEEQKQTTWSIVRRTISICSSAGVLCIDNWIRTQGAGWPSGGAIAEVCPSDMSVQINYMTKCYYRVKMQLSLLWRAGHCMSLNFQSGIEILISNSLLPVVACCDSRCPLWNICCIKIKTFFFGMGDLHWYHYLAATKLPKFRV